jgi:hypothetical protein
MTDTTHVLMVVDMSGSMSPLAEDVRGGFNTYIETLKEGKGRYRVTATVFDTEFEPLCVASKLKHVPPLTTGNYMPRGMTALCDAIGKTITDFERLTTLGDDDRVLLVVQTDGEENASREFNATQVKALITERETGGKWVAVFLGANLDSISQAGSMGFTRQNTVDTSLGGRLDNATSTRSIYVGAATATMDYAETGVDTALAATITDTLEDSLED